MGKKKYIILKVPSNPIIIEKKIKNKYDDFSMFIFSKIITIDNKNNPKVIKSLPITDNSQNINELNRYIEKIKIIFKSNLK